MVSYQKLTIAPCSNKEQYTVCPTHYRTRNFFNNSNTNEDIATKFEQEYVRCVRNEKEYVCNAPNCCDTEQRSASQPGFGSEWDTLYNLDMRQNIDIAN